MIMVIYEHTAVDRFSFTLYTLANHILLTWHFTPFLLTPEVSIYVFKI